ncbi:MAG: ABC transporter substrate-binding protein [Simplicispira sp.]|nr:ABC transporter substrate-binding protein [Simplicispira sp.]
MRSGQDSLGPYRHRGHAAAYIAQEEGFFKKRGVDVEFQQVFDRHWHPVCNRARCR